MKCTIFSLLPVLTLVALGWAQEPPPKPEHPPCHEMMMDKFEKLDLSAEQAEQIESIKNETKRAIIPVKAEIELKEIDLQNEMKKDNLDRAKIMKITKEINALELKIKETHIDEKLKVHSVLTPEQIEKLRTWRHIHKNIIAPKHKCDKE